MRLIYADKIKGYAKYIKTNENFEPYIMIADLAKLFDEQPTAYDIDAVVSELRRRSGNGYRDIDGDYVPPMIKTEKAIEIVKRGCVTDDCCEWKHGERFRGMETFKTGCCGKTMVFTALEAADIKDCPEYAMKYCPYCGKKIEVVE